MILGAVRRTPGSHHQPHIYEQLTRVIAPHPKFILLKGDVEKGWTGERGTRGRGPTFHQCSAQPLMEHGPNLPRKDLLFRGSPKSRKSPDIRDQHGQRHNR
jgi:hypothetical protein